MKIKKRILALNIGLIAVMVFSIIYIMIADGHYTLHTRSFYIMDELPAYEAVVEDESILSCDRVYYSDECEVLADLTALHEGRTRVGIRMVGTTREDETEFYTFEVNAFGTLFERTSGIVNFNGVTVVVTAIAAELALMLIVMLWLFIDYFRKGEFSYPMIACGGLSIYLVFLLIYVSYYLITNSLFSFTFFLNVVADAGKVMLYLLSPLMILMCALLAFSNIWLMRHEGFRPVNALGIVFAVLWLAGMGFVFGFIPYVWSIPYYYYIIIPVIYVIGYLECMFISTVCSSFLATRYRVPSDRDYLIILGCAIRSDGSLTPLLKGRVDRAVDFEKKQFEKTGKHAVFVPSGGQGSDEVISEGEAMEKYLLSIGIPAEQIMREDKSTNTYENMAFSGKVIENARSDLSKVKIGFSTTNYHVFRGYILAKKNGLEAKGLSAKTKPYFFPNAFLREFVGLLVDQKWKHAVFILLTAVFFTTLSFISF